MKKCALCHWRCGTLYFAFHHYQSTAIFWDDPWFSDERGSFRLVLIATSACSSYPSSHVEIQKGRRRCTCEVEVDVGVGLAELIPCSASVRSAVARIRLLERRVLSATHKYPSDREQPDYQLLLLEMRIPREFSRERSSTFLPALMV